MVQPGQKLLQIWDAQAIRLYRRMEVTGDGLVLGAGTVLAKMTRDERGAPFSFLADEQRTIALLTTAYEQPLEPHLLAKMRRACELWNDGEKALAHIHLAHASLPQCDEARALRLFVAEELLESETTRHTLLKAQGFDTAALDLSKFSPTACSCGEWAAKRRMDEPRC